MSNWGKIAIAVVGVTAAAMPAWASDAFKYIPAKQVAADVADTSKGPAVKIYFNHDTFLEEVAARDKTGQVEIHKSWNDYITALSGEAKLTVGGTPVGMKPTDPGEQRGDHVAFGRYGDHSRRHAALDPTRSRRAFPLPGLQDQGTRLIFSPSQFHPTSVCEDNDGR
jgi:hypothetical protein